MKKTTIIVGAGATLAEALPSQRNRKKQPPLDKTFFDLCRLSNYQGQGPIKEFMLKEFGVNPFGGNSGMEEVFNYIYSEAFSSSPPTGCLSAYWALINLYRTSIIETTNPLKGNSRYGIGQVLRTLLDHDRDRNIGIITFNQDLVIEKAIEHTKMMKKYSYIPWNIRLAYGIPFSSMPRLSNNSQPFFEDDKSLSIVVCKMHGSLNWVYRVRKENDPQNSIRRPRTKLIGINDEQVYPRITQKSGGKGRSYDLIPLIVPPIYEKSAVYRNVIDPVWKNAQKILSETEELIVFGYSFPDADFAARSIIRHCLHDNSKIMTIHIIDKDPNVTAKIVNLFGKESVHYYKNAQIFSKVYCEEQ